MEAEGIGFVLLFVVMVIVVTAIIRSEMRQKLKPSLEKTKNDYFNSLSKLKNEPTNSDLKKTTLDLGRAYSQITRKFEGDEAITIYDEMALMNDINAACAGAMKTNAANPQTAEVRLSKLSELKEKGLINEQEYETKRKSVIEEI